MKIGLLTDYVKTYENILSKEECEKVIKEIEEAEWQKHSYYNPVTNTNTSYDNDLSVSNAIGQAGIDVQNKLWDVINTYVQTDMAEMKSWFNSWAGYSPIRFNKYDKTTEMRIHCDHITSLFEGQRKGIPVLTVLGSLNDGYEGGEFVMFEDQVIEMPSGSVVVFPSNFLYPHEVKPIKSGVRYSYVSWVW